MQSPPRRTVKELLLHMANELRTLLSVIPKKSRNIFKNFLIVRQRSENVENGVCPLNWPEWGQALQSARRMADKKDGGQALQRNGG